MTLRKAVKKLGVGFGVLVLLLLCVIAIAPHVINVDNYRGAIVTAADRYLNGKLELGRLSLSLWGKIGVEAEGATLANPEGEKILSVKNAVIEIPIIALLTGKPLLLLKMDNPEILIAKDGKGKWNVLSLMKKNSKNEVANPSGNYPLVVSGDSSGLSETPPSNLQAFAAKAHVGVEIRHAIFHYKEEGAEPLTKVEDLNLEIKDFSLFHPTEMKVWADLDTRLGKTVKVRGPLRMYFDFKPEFQNNEFRSAMGQLRVSMDDLEITVPEWFEKKKGIAANLEGDFKFEGDRLCVDKLMLRFFNAEVTGSGLISGIGELPAAIDLKLKSNAVELKPWPALIPILKDFDLDGTATFDGSLMGTSLLPKYHANLGFVGVAAKSPHLMVGFKKGGVGLILVPDVAKKKLRVNGKLKIEKASFASTDAARVVNEGLNKVVDDLAGKLPTLKGKMINQPVKTDSKYAEISSDFVIEQGIFFAPNFLAKAEPDKGIDLKGEVSVNLTDYALKANWEVVDTYNLTHARELSLSQSGLKVEHLLAEGNNPVHFPIQLSGTLFSPQVSFAAVPEVLGKVALNNLSQGMKKKTDEQIKAAVGEIPKPIQDAIQDIGKKLFGH